MYYASCFKIMAASLLLSAGHTSASEQATCDPNANAAEPSCPYGHWCPGDGVCPPNPCLDFPCGSHGRCDLDPQPDSTKTEHTPFCVCNSGFHCANDDCYVPMSCVPDDVPPCECQDCDIPQGDKCIQDQPPSHGCHCKKRPDCPPDFTCPSSHMHEDPDNPCHCICDTGYCGPECQTYDPGCCDVSCSEHGHCIDINGAGRCECDFADKSVDPATHHPAWYGDQCQLLDQCREKNCGSHGKCVDSNPDCGECMSAHCQCDTCWSGENCDIHEECCDFGGCNGHGQVVIDTDGNCSCECDSCYSGDHCEREPDKCVDVTTGTCQPTTRCGHCGQCNSDSGHCDCDPGWRPASGGDTCDAYDPCLTHNCGSHGHCEPGDDWLGSASAMLGADRCTASATCNCDPGYKGPACEVDLCVGSVCGSHGRCVHTTEHPGTCECRSGWTGEHCDVPPPVVDPCEDEHFSCGSNGQCTTDADGHAKCICDRGWCGDHCEVIEWNADGIAAAIMPGSMSGGQMAGAGAVGLVAVGAMAIGKRKMFSSAASSLDEPIV